MPAKSPPADEEVIALVARALEKVGVRYAVGGSAASSIYGEPRATKDVDFAVQLGLDQVPRFVRELGTDFEADEEALAEAVQRQRSWNIFHLPSMLKIDLFVRGGSPYDESELRRTRLVELSPGGPAVQMSSPEDNLLWKLRWYRMGGDASEQQWRDVVGIVRVTGTALDRAYLKRWARELGVADLLKRALVPGPKRRRKG